MATALMTKLESEPAQLTSSTPNHTAGDEMSWLGSRR